MNIVFIFYVVFSILITSCGGGSVSNDTNNVISGVTQKGQFVKGSSVTAYKLSNNGERDDSNTIKTTTTDNLGSFKFDNIPWRGATEFVILGNYFNEINATNTRTPTSISLIKVVDNTNTDNIKSNINILTHLEAQRIKRLMSQGVIIKNAQIVAKENIKNF